MKNENKFYLVQEFFLAIECPKTNDPEILEVTTYLELTEFGLTEEEIQKLRKIMKKLELKLTDKFSEATLAASVSANICLDNRQDTHQAQKSLSSFSQ